MSMSCHKDDTQLSRALFMVWASLIMDEPNVKKLKAMARIFLYFSHSTAAYCL